MAVAMAGSLFFTVPTSQARERVAMYLLLTMAPFALIAPVLGPILDRHFGARRLLVILGAGGRGLLAWILATRIDGFLVFPVAFAVLVLSRAHGVVRAALVPSVVSEPARYVDANARLARLSVVAGAIGAMPGAGILKIWGSPWVLRAAALVYLASAASAVRLPRPGRSQRPAFAPFHPGPHALAAALPMAALRGLVGFTVFLLAFGLRRLHMADVTLGYMIALYGAASFAGTLVAPALAAATSEEYLLLSGVLVTAGAGVGLGFASGIWPLAAFTTLLGLAAGGARLGFDGVLQRFAPDASRGRVFARFETRLQLAWVAGAALPTVLPIPLNTGLWLEGIAAIAAAMAYGFVLFSFRRHPPAMPA